MRSLFCFIICVFLVLCAPPSVGRSEEKKLTLAEAVKIALEENYDLRAKRSALLAEKDGVNIARSYFFPRLSFEERATRTNNPPQVFMVKLNQDRFSSSDFDIDALNKPDPVNDYQTSFVLEQPLFSLPSYRGFFIAKKMYAAKNVEYLRKREETVFSVAEAYLRVQTAKEYLAVAQQGVEDSKEHLRITQIRYKNSLGLYSDVLRAQTTMTQAEQGLVSMKNAYETAKHWLGLVIAATSPVDAADEDVTISIRDIEYYRKASAARLDLNAMRIRTDTAMEKVQLAKSAYFPYVGLMGAFQTNDHNNLFGDEGHSWQVSAHLRWNLFDGTKREFELSKARHEAAEAQQRLTGFKELIAFKTTEAHLAVEEAKKNLELAEAALKSAEEGRRLVKNRFENSLSPMVDLLDAQFTLDRARADAAAKRRGYKMAILNLGFESGSIMKDLNIE